MASEAHRLYALQKLDLLGSAPSESFDRMTRMASQIFDLPIAAISLTDTDRQWFKSRVGVEHWSIPRDKAPCAHVAETCRPLVVEDLLNDGCYRDSNLARSGVRFYAGAPLITRDGWGLGAMCVLGTAPRAVTPAEVAALHDLAAIVMAQIELEHAFGRVDPVSALPNRTQFLEDLSDLARDSAGLCAAVLIDLIGFDQFNHVMRVMGPAAIDEMVQRAARDVRGAIGPGRKVYHVGTTQFVALVPDGVDPSTYGDVLARRIDEAGKRAGSGAVGTSAVGVAPFVLGETLPSDVLRMAQGAAQDARSAGRSFHVHSDRADTAFRRSFELLRDFEAALESGTAFHLVYQPRMDLASGLCVGAEALMRWTHPTLGPVAPGEFIPLIERTALAGATTAWVVETALAQQARWRAAGIDLIVSVNISAANLHEPDLAHRVQEALRRHGVPPAALEVEVTETAVMSDAELALAQLTELGRAGVRVAIDDFGTGQSSLSYLQRLPLQVVKIDRSFIGQIATDDRQRSLAAMMVSMAKHLGYRVVAEGVETTDVRDLLRPMGCDEVQGYLYARPLPPEDLVAWLRRSAGIGPVAA